MKPGNIKKYDVICTLPSISDICDDFNNTKRVLITLPRGRDVNTALNELTAPFRRASAGTTSRPVHRNKELLNYDKNNLPYVNILDLMIRARYEELKK